METVVGYSMHEISNPSLLLLLLLLLHIRIDLTVTIRNGFCLHIYIYLPGVICRIYGKDLWVDSWIEIVPSWLVIYLSSQRR